MKEETFNTEILSITRNYYEQLYTNKACSPKEMNKFLETYNLSRLNNEEVEKLSRSVTSKVIDSIIKNLPTKKGPGF